MPVTSPEYVTEKVALVLGSPFGLSGTVASADTRATAKITTRIEHIMPVHMLLTVFIDTALLSFLWFGFLCSDD